MNLKGKKILLFVPSFFSYDLAIKKKLESLGASVVLCDDRPSNNSLIKGIIRVKRNLIKPFIERYFDRILENNKDADFDFVFFVKGESASVHSLERLKLRYQNAKFILYLWDSVHNNDNASIYNYFDKVLSFDKDDCKNYNDFVFRPLFYLDDYKQILERNISSNDYLYSFVGTVHSDRFFVVKSIVNAFNTAEDKGKVVLYLPSKLLFWFRKITEPKFRLVPFSDICFTPVLPKDLISIFSNSKIIIDIQHPKQTGLTMRVVETLGAGKKIITTNQDIVNYDFYNENNILILDRDNIVIPSGFLESDYVPVDKLVYDKYSIDGWIYECFKDLL